MTQMPTYPGFMNLSHALAGLQMLCVAFGALVLMPLLTGLSPAVALFTAGVGTLLFQWVTGRQVPVFLASSFAFIAPTLVGMERWGVEGTLCGLLSAGFAYVSLSLLIQWKGMGLVSRLLPPIVTGPVILSIGLILAPVAANLAMGKSGNGSQVLHPPGAANSVALASLVATIVLTLYGRGVWKLIPLLGGILVGCGVAAFAGLVDFDSVSQAPWLSLPPFTFPEWNLDAVIYMLPFSLAVAIEHFGDISAIGQATGKDYLRKPGLHRTYLGDGLASLFAALLGGPPNTTYSEVTGAVILTRQFNPLVMTWAAAFAIGLAFLGKLNGLLLCIPTPVMGGILLAIFGSICVVGIRTMAEMGEKILYPRNVLVIGISLTAGIGGLVLPLGSIGLEGVSLTAALAFGLNAVLPAARPWNS